LGNCELVERTVHRQPVRTF